MLSRSADVDASGIEVTVKEGIVYLNGSVDGRQMKRMAELEIENISGVTDVQNLLAISKRPEGNLS
jgi:osmotically-inducible protein OsmY